MKKATLFGILGISVLLIRTIIYTLPDFLNVFRNLETTFYQFLNLSDMLGYLFILIFFIQLYKKQK